MPDPNVIPRRDAFIQAAAAEFDKAGYAAASLSTIAARVGKTKGAMRYHFASKAALARAVIETQYAQWEDVLAAVRAGGYNGIDALIVLAFVVAARFRDDVLVRAALSLLGDPGLQGVELPTPFVGWIDMTTRLLAEAGSLGELDSVLDAEAAAEVLVEVFAGAQDAARRLTNMQDLELRVWRYWLLCLPGLGIHDGAERVPRLAEDAARY
ncbi:ScbR family autoregulator-binding transcription factor [Gryllotalpicola reticulitermitis]|uniref:ScbR family autoregulator-binding transcription factor n=1 Tax=Gryllotalpicola reticulitermitis TaxID=1184153 RepID=A0ABV8Q8P1_9MICO